MNRIEVLAVLVRAGTPRLLHEGDWHADAGGVWLADPDKLRPEPVALRMLARPDSSVTPCVSGGDKDVALKLAAMLPELVAALVMAHSELAIVADVLPKEAPLWHRTRVAEKVVGGVLEAVRGVGR